MVAVSSLWERKAACKGSKILACSPQPCAQPLQSFSVLWSIAGRMELLHFCGQILGSSSGQRDVSIVLHVSQSKSFLA